MAIPPPSEVTHPQGRNGTAASLNSRLSHIWFGDFMEDQQTGVTVKDQVDVELRLPSTRLSADKESCAHEGPLSRLVDLQYLVVYSETSTATQSKKAMNVITRHANHCRAPGGVVARNISVVAPRVPEDLHRKAQADHSDSASGFDLHDSQSSRRFQEFCPSHIKSTKLPQLDCTARVKPNLHSLPRLTSAPAHKRTPLSTAPGFSCTQKFNRHHHISKSTYSTLLGEHSERQSSAAPSHILESPMTSESTSTPPSSTPPAAQHKPLVVGRTKPQSASTTMDSSSTVPGEVKDALNNEIASNVQTNTSSAAPDAPPTNKAKKEKAPKQPKPPKAPAAPVAPVSPALIDLRVGHILRAIAHPNADSLYVSTIAMGDPEGTEHTQIDDETGKVVRIVCSGLNGLIPLEEMQNRKVVVVANLKPVNMRSIKSAAMVLAASPPAEEGADPHAADRIVELVNPPEGAEAGEAVYFEGWPYGEGKGPEKQLNPKKKVWEGVQPGFFTSEDLEVGFDAGRPGVEIEGEKEKKGLLIVEGKGRCTVKTLKGAVVR